MIVEAKAQRLTAFVPYEGGAPVERVIERLRRCKRVERVVVVHGVGDTPALDAERVAVGGPLMGPVRGRAIAGRKWATTCWRGGVGGATVYDELIEPAALAEAMRLVGVDAGLLVGPDWPVVDPALCDAVIERHLGNPRSHRMVFTQAPPGLCGIVLAAELLGEAAEKRVMLGAMLAYQPAAPQGDPIAKDVCVQTPAELRGAMVRATSGHARWRKGLETFGGDCAAVEVATRLQPDRRLPQQLNIEITPKRRAAGPITPQHHTVFDRQPMTLELFDRIVGQFEPVDDLVVTLGGIGDALCHERWGDFVRLSRECGAWGVGVQTDLLVDQAALEQLVASPVDVITVRVNADSAARYTKLMGVDAFEQVFHNIEWLLTNRRAGLPWVVPAMTKTTENVEELETFVDRWTYYAGHALVTGPSTGRGAMPDQSVMAMPLPARYVALRDTTAMTVLSNGRVAPADDWLGHDAIGDLCVEPVAEVWARQVDAALAELAA